MKSVQQSLMSMLREHSARKYVAVVVCMIAVVTVIAVFWSLRISGLTLASEDPTCGLQEHTHTDACYDWVATNTDSTEDIDEAESTEAAEETETAGDSDSADGEDETDEAPAETEEAEASESASEVDTDAEEAEATESVAEESEETDGTESVTEEADENATESVTEDATEEITEEETESPQPGDTKVVDGVTYVYELVCGLEEHVHTDECYESDDTEEDANVAEETDEISLDDLNAGIATLSLDDDYGITVASDDDDTSVYAQSVTVTTSNDWNSYSSSEGYYFADPTSLATVATEVSEDADETYVIYTEINGTYYLLSGDGSLVACTSDTTSAEENYVNWTPYIYASSTPDESYIKYYTSAFDSYRWQIGDASSSGTGDYTYQIYNDASTYYLAVSDSDTVSATGNRYELSDGETIKLTIYCGTAGEFWVEIFDNSSTVQYITTTSDREKDAWYYNATGDNITCTYEDGSYSTIESGTTYTVYVTKDAEDYTITYTYTDSNNEEVVFAEYVASGTSITSDDVNLHVIANSGSYTVSAKYMDTTVDCTDLTASAYDIANQQTGVHTLDGDFDVIYTFKNTSTDAATVVSGITQNQNWYNFVVVLTDDSGNLAVVRADYFGWVYFNTTDTTTNYVASNFSTTTGSVDWDAWISALQSGADCEVEIIKTTSSEDDTVTVRVVITLTGMTGMNDLTYYVDLNITGFDSTLNVYLSGEYCVLADVEYMNADGSTTTYQDIYSRTSKSAADTVINAADSDGYGWNANVTLSSDDTYYLYGESNSEGADSIEWGTNSSVLSGADITGQDMESSTNTTYTTVTFYFARVREYTVWFDATNGGNGMYSGAVYVWHTNLSSTMSTRTINRYGTKTYADSEGYCYADVPYAYCTTAYQNLGYTNGKYPYALQGWYDINGKSSYNDGSTSYGYYSFYNTDWDSITWSSRYPTFWTITSVRISGDTVFYADWVASTYDINSDSSGNISDKEYVLEDASSNTSTYDNGDTKGGIDTNGFITTKVFDYNELFNLYSANIFSQTITDSSNSESWSLVTRGSNIVRLGTGSWEFLFLNLSSSYPLSSVNGRNNQNGAQQDRVEKGITKSSIFTESLASTAGDEDSLLIGYLFDTDNIFDSQTGEGVLGKTYVGLGNYLFQFSESTGYYYYDASKNAATYNQTYGRFYLYDGTIRAVSASSYDFLPFNYELLGGSSDSAINADGSITNVVKLNATNYWFGMSSEINFYLPDNVGTTDDPTNSSSTGSDLVFKFLGDDDVWVFVDGVLVLDMGGIHGECYGEINFSTGEVNIVNSEYIDYVDRDSTVIGILSSAYATTGIVDQTTLTDLLGSTMTSGSHTLTIYYLERGGSQSNCAIYFNISPVYSFQLTKVLGDDSYINADDEVEFEVYTSSDFSESSYVGTMTNIDGILRIDGLRPLVTYYIKETNAPEDYPLSYKYLTVIADTVGNVTASVYNSDETFVESLSCDIEEDIASETSEETYSRTGDSNADLKARKLATNTHYLLNDLSTYGTENETYGSYYLFAVIYANYLEYELPATGSIGTFPYEYAGTVLVLVSITGLLIIAFYHLVWVRKLCTSGNNKGYTEEKRKRGKHFARTRDHLRQRSGSYGRDAPAAFAYSGKERSRGTGPGTK